jgi:hypothetical protein
MNDRADPRKPRDRRTPAQDRSLWLVALGGLAVVLCCAGPALVAGGLLSALGVATSNAIVIVLGLAIVAGGVIVTVARRRRVRRSDDGSAPATPRTNRDRGRQ